MSFRVFFQNLKKSAKKSKLKNLLLYRNLYFLKYSKQSKMFSVEDVDKTIDHIKPRPHFFMIYSTLHQ